MQIGMIGLGRMGANMVARLVEGGHECVVHDVAGSAVRRAAAAGAKPAFTLEELVTQLRKPRIVWLMIPTGAIDDLLGRLTPLLAGGDIVVDGGNSHYTDTRRRSEQLTEADIAFVDVGTSGGIWGREIGYCQMIGGAAEPVATLEPVFAALATGERESAAYLHCGPSGAGHFVKMVHNGVEYGLMQAYAEGFNLLSRASAGDALPGYDFDIAAIAEVWRHGSVIRSWLLDLTSRALAEDPALGQFDGVVADSGEGRWMLAAAAERAAPVPALAAALFARFGSRDGSDFGNRTLSAMRKAFGGHVEPQDD
jgi:6-phosphogluconate dehydrogenase